MASIKLREPTEEEKRKIYSAANDGDVHIIQHLSSSGVDVTGIIDPYRLNQTALHYAAERGHNSIVTFLLNHGARVNDVDVWQRTPLHWASLNSRPDIVDTLVKSGADVNMKDGDNKTPLELAVEEGHSKTVEYITEHLKMNTTNFNDETQKIIDEPLKETEKKQSSSNEHPKSHGLQQGNNEEQIQEALSLALKNGVANSSSVTIYVLGQESAGKSCLVTSLLGGKFEERIATQGADVDICKIFASKWSRVEKSKMPKRLKHIYHSKLKVTAQITIPAEQKQPVLNASGKQELLDSLPELPEAVKADLEQAKTAVLIDEDGIDAVIWDFAGQSVYYGLHSMFLKENNVAMIVFDASQSLRDSTKGRGSHKDPYTQKSINPTITGCESVCYWLQSIHSICRKDGRRLGATSQCIPTVILVATHIDLIGDSEAVEIRKQEIIDQLFLALKGKPFARHLAGIMNGLREALEKNCFFISNKVPDQEELDRLRQLLVEASQYITNAQHPIVYINIEQKLLSLNKTAISTAEFHSIAQNSGFFTKPGSIELKGALAHFHQKGTILHFPNATLLKDVVVLLPDWLTKLFSYIIVAHPYKYDCDHDMQFERLRDRGVLEEDFITFMVNKFNKEQVKFGLPLSTKQAIEFAQLFGFVAEVNSTTYFLEEMHQPPVSKNRVFIVPPMLPLKLPDDLRLPDDKDPLARIVYFQFSEGFIPLMIYYQMLGACIDRNIKRNENLYWIRRHMIKMVLGYDQLYYVNLCEDECSIRLAIIPDEDEIITPQDLQERWKLIEDFTAKLREIVNAFMPASSLPQCYIPCSLCPNLHLKLDSVRADDRPLRCFHGKLPKDYYSDLRKQGGAKIPGDLKVISKKEPTMQKLCFYLESVTEWEAFGYQLLPEDKGHLVEMIRRDFKETIPCKIALYRNFLQCGVKSWEQVIKALERSGHGDTAEQVKVQLCEDLPCTG